jgi:hypothetical protein
MYVDWVKALRSITDTQRVRFSSKAIMKMSHLFPVYPLCRGGETEVIASQTDQHISVNKSPSSSEFKLRSLTQTI